MGGVRMYIGELLKARLNMFGLSKEQFAENCMFDIEYINAILDNKVSLEEIDDFDLDVISTALFCTPEYFSDENARKQDVVFSSCNRGKDTSRSNYAKGRLQKYMRDMLMLKEALN